MASPFCPSAAHVHNLQNPKEIHCCLNYWVHGTQADTQTKDLAFPLFIQSLLYFETEVFLHMLPD